MFTHSSLFKKTFLPAGSISYNVTTKGSGNGAVQVTLYDKNGQQVASSASASGTLNVANANLWWPRRMNAQVGYLYTLHVRLPDEPKYPYVNAERRLWTPTGSDPR
jgi:beta-galactosidase/beta-glucuronidase